MAYDESTHIWDLPGCPFGVEFACSVLDQVNAEVIQAFYSVPKRGAETGGVLYGTRTASRVTILLARPLGCEHAFGPSFTLSDNDLARLSALLVSPEALAQPPEMSVVGWYRSLTRGEISLTDGDLAIHREFFREPWHLAVVLRPMPLLPTRLGVFYCRADGSLVPNGAHAEFVVARPARLQAAAAAAGAGAVESAQCCQLGELNPTEPTAARRPRVRLRCVETERRSRRRQPALSRRAAGRAKNVPRRAALPAFAPKRLPISAQLGTRRRRFWWVLLASVVCLAAVGVYVGIHSEGGRRDSRPAALTLSAADREGQLQIAWNRDATAGVVSGILQVHDGEALKTFVLDRERIDAGSIDYPRRSKVVSVSLTLVRNDGSELRSSTNYAAGGGAAPRMRGAVPVPQPSEHRPPSTIPSAALKPDGVTVRASQSSAPDPQDPQELVPEKPPLVTAGIRAASASERHIFRPPTPRHTEYLPSPPTVESSQAAMNHRIVLPVAAPPTPAPALKHPSIAGYWTSRGVRSSQGNSIRSGVGRPSAMAARAPSLSLPSGPVYPPESVEVFMSDDRGEVFGSLVGRYRASKTSGLNREVSFTFDGSPDRFLRFPWKGADGSEGEVEFIPVPSAPDTIRIVWYANGRKAVFDHFLRRIYSY